MKKNFLLPLLLLSILAILTFPLNAQEAVFQSASLNKISLAATKKPVTRKLTMKKWFTSKTDKDKNFSDFQKQLKEQGVYITPPLNLWVKNKYFNKTTNPLDETWVLFDGNSMIIRHYSPDKAKNLQAEVYSLENCNLQCKNLGLKKQLQYQRSVNLIKFDPKNKKSFNNFKDLLSRNNVLLHNYQLEEIKEKFFNSSKFTKQFPKDDLVSWSIITGDKIIIRFARKKNDIDFSAISIPYSSKLSKSWSLKTNASASGFSTTAEDVESYLNLSAGFELTKTFHNSLGALVLSNLGQASARLIKEESKENPSTYMYSDRTLLEQELFEQFKMFSSLDFYHDSASGIVLGMKVLPGLGWNILGYGNRYRVDPVLSTAFGYRYEKDEIISGTTTDEIVYKDIILSHIFSIGNREYGGAAVYWRVKVQYQYALFSSNTNQQETLLYSPTDRYRINYLVQMGIPILNGSWKLFLTYLQEDINDQLEITNKQGMLSFEAKIF